MSTWVLLRGLARESRHWGGFAPALRQQLPPGHTVCTVDLPGTGALWRERSPDTVAGLVQAARRELARMPHQGPCLLVALSLGGMVAREWAAQDPHAVRGCVLINTSLGGLAPFWQRLRPASYPALLGLLRPGQSALRREQAILRLTSNLPVSDAVAAAWAEYAESAPVTRSNVLIQLAAAARYRADTRAPAVPTLLLASCRDRLVSVECSRRIAQAWGVPLRVHRDAGHDLPLDDPTWVITEITRWYALGAEPR
jgi:pimeloyl-ACP methyl ester carboxylesterase